MNTLLSYTASAYSKDLENKFLFGFITLLLMVGTLYFLLYLGLSQLVKSNSPSDEEIPQERTIFV